MPQQLPDVTCYLVSKAVSKRYQICGLKWPKVCRCDRQKWGITQKCKSKAIKNQRFSSHFLVIRSEFFPIL